MIIHSPHMGDLLNEDDIVGHSELCDLSIKMPATQ